MILGPRVPQSFLPPAKVSWKATTVEDVVSLVKLANGQDPAWRFVEIRQIDEIRRNVDCLISVSDRQAALVNKSSNFPSIREAIASAKVQGAPLFAREMCLFELARDRLASWESGATKKFEDAPMGLRVLLNTRNRQSHRRLLDNSNCAGYALLTDAVRVAQSKGWLTDSSSGRPKPSEAACEAMIAVFKGSAVRPLGAETLAAIVRAPAGNFARVGEEVLKIAQDELSRYFGAAVDSTGSISRGTGVSTKVPIVEHAIEVLQHRVQARPSRQQIVKAATIALNTFSDPSVKDTTLPQALVREVAELCLPQDPTGSKATAAEYYLHSLAPVLCALPRGFSAILDYMEFYAEESFASGEVRDNKGPVLQREALSIAGHWLSRPDVPGEIKDSLKRILLKGASPYAPRLSLEVALHWIGETQEVFTSKELGRVALDILEYQERKFLYHTLYISSRSARTEGRIESRGALEMVVDLVKAGRLGVDEASRAYRAAGMYRVRREREPGNGLWRFQRRDTFALMAELNALCGGEPERRYGADLAQLDDARRSTRNESARTMRIRQVRMQNLAGNFMSRQPKN
jgi:hypothetical protein